MARKRVPYYRAFTVVSCRIFVGGGTFLEQQE